MTGRATTSILENLRSEWEERARTVRPAAAYYRSGELDVERDIVPRLPTTRARALEIGCGAGRMTRALSRLFETLYAVDVAAGMVSLTRAALADCPNVHVLHNDGRSLDLVPSQLDMAVAYGVFPHLPREWIENYARQVGSRLRPGGGFLFEVVAGFEVAKMLETCGCELRQRETDGRPYDLVWSVRR
jgi:SAM-dependent methyltransferase